MGQPAARLEQQVVGRLRLVRSVLSEPGQRAVDDAVIDRADRVVTDSQTRRDTGPVTFDQHVGFRAQAQQKVLAARIPKIERDRALTPVQQQVLGRKIALLSRPFDAQGLRAPSAHEEAAEFTRRHDADFEDRYAVECVFHVDLLFPSLLQDDSQPNLARASGGIK